MKEALLYIHIPFCIAKCDYCDFFSLPSSVKTLDSSYIDALIKEVSFWKKKFSISSWKTLYIGGGTPSLMSPSLTEKLLSSILEERDSKPEEITIEVNPETLTEEKLLLYSNCGVNRISMGLQSFNDKALKKCSRHCTSKNIYEALSLLEKFWKGKLNLDLIAGLEDQSDDEFLQSLEKACTSKADHISLYTLTLEEGTALYKKTNNGKDFDYEKADSQWFMGRSLLEKYGFEQYEVSNFAKKGHESLHNMGYWMQKDYIGAGGSACGSIYGKKGVRWTCKRDIDSYIKYWNDFDLNDENIDFPLTSEIEELDINTLEFEYLMMGLRTLRGVSEKEYFKRYSKVLPWCGNLEKRLSCIKNIKIRDFNGERYFYLDKEGLLFLNSTLESLMTL